ncbi:MAG: FAD-binding oxidoreductase [Rhodospirillales bacterium]|nr:MAG: FAD-binding oxidoreductase [Rhodospirillales bacterium]
MSISSIGSAEPATGALTRIREVVGPKGWIDRPEDLEPFLIEERGRFHGRCLAVVRPADTAEVAAVVRSCWAAAIPLVPHGGNTGLVGGGVPDGGIVLSTARLNRIRNTDHANRAMTVEAGVILADVQAAAEQAGLLFPLSLAAEGSCQIGGNLATNAGGVTVVRYGNARDLVLGLEVVLPDGRIWNGLRALRKDNTGYDLKHLFLGSEGTLGIITAAVLKLFARPRATATALVAIPTPAAAIALLDRVQDACGDALTAFELLSRPAVTFCCRHIAGIADPFAEPHPWYVLVHLTSPRAGDSLTEALEAVLGDGLEQEIVVDAVIAQNEGQVAELWRLRESIPEAQKPEGGSIKNDVSVPVSRVPEFLERATAAVEAAMSGIRVVAFGHVGDGNIHFNLSQPVGVDRDAFLAEWDRFDRIVADIATDLGGSFSAEHGVGRLKRSDMARYKDPVELDLMRTLKRGLDPAGIMNPGKLIVDG